jgi:hypothetical protein
VVLNPATSLSAIENVLDVTDLVLIMSVNPGFGGQSFIESQVAKIRALKQMCLEKVRPRRGAGGRAGGGRGECRGGGEEEGRAQKALEAPALDWRSVAWRGD